MSNKDPKSVSYFGRANFHLRHTPFGIKQSDRLSHVYMIGKTGVGKSTLMETLAWQDLRAGRGFALVDPHGDLVEKIAADIPPDQADRVIYLNAPDPSQPYGYNPLRRVRDDKIPLAVSGLLETLEKMWPDAWGVRMEHVLRNTLYTLLERDDAKLPDILRLYSDEDFRKEIVGGTKASNKFVVENDGPRWRRFEGADRDISQSHLSHHCLSRRPRSGVRACFAAILRLTEISTAPET